MADPVVRDDLDGKRLTGSELRAGRRFYGLSIGRFCAHTQIIEKTLKKYEAMPADGDEQPPAWLAWVFATYEAHPDRIANAQLRLPYRDWGVDKDSDAHLHGTDIAAALRYYEVSPATFSVHSGYRPMGVARITEDPNQVRRWPKWVLYLYDRNPESRLIQNRPWLPIDRWLGAV